MIKLSVTHLRSWSEKVRGLIGASPVYPVFFSTRWGIHTFGVRSAIDVLILDDSMHVVTVRHNLPPNRIFLWSPVYKYVAELPAGSIKEKGIQRGDRITLIA